VTGLLHALHRIPDFDITPRRDHIRAGGVGYHVRMHYRILETCTGPFVLMEDDQGTLTTSWMTAQVRALIAKGHHDRQMRNRLAQRLQSFFAGKGVSFEDVPTPRSRGAEFYERCWEACRSIPRGQTRSYAELAVMADSTASAARAAGQAMRNNPLPVIVPCHRVIGASGHLHGFGGSCDAQGGELHIKRILLDLERTGTTTAKNGRSARAFQRSATNIREAVGA
jgi:methylated-DNA-[protein]-cysteine S-methyltransferase